MKILVLSDSHGEIASMARAILEQGPDAVIHLGDCVPDANALQARFPALTIYQVKGNNDWRDQTPERLELSLEGVRILAVHGHQYGVYSGPLRVSLAAREAGADVALYGHTHIPACERTRDGLWLLNPGACGKYTPTCGVIEIANGRCTCYNAPVETGKPGKGE